MACLLLSIIPMAGMVSAGTTDLPAGAGLFLDFSDEATLDKATIPAASAAMVTKYYDSENQVMVVHPTNGGKGTSRIEILPSDIGTVSAVKYPILAMRVKLSDTFMDGKTGYMELSTDQMGTAVYQGPINYENTTEWQTIYIDLSNPANAAWSAARTNYKYFMNPDSDNNPNTTDTWDKLLLDFCAGSYSISKGCKFSVKWIGLFNNVAAVYDCADMNYAEKRVLHFDSANASTTGVLGNYTIGTTSSTISYDAGQNAVKVVSNGSTTEMGITVSLLGNAVSSTEYPILAYKVKLGSADLATYEPGTLAYTISSS